MYTHWTNQSESGIHCFLFLFLSFSCSLWCFSSWNGIVFLGSSTRLFFCVVFDQSILNKRNPTKSIFSSAAPWIMARKLFQFVSSKWKENIEHTHTHTPGRLYPVWNIYKRQTIRMLLLGKLYLPVKWNLPYKTNGGMIKPYFGI